MTDLEPNSTKSIEKDQEQVSQNPVQFSGKIVVDWDGPDDPEFPKNWKPWKKILTTVLISFCTVAQYLGAAIITPAMAQTQEHFHTTRTKNALGLTLFIWGYGIGCLWFTPMSEIPVFRGRSPTYLFCLFVFTCLQIPTGLVNHIAPFAVLRFIGGLFASPPLATAGATLTDIWDMPSLGIALAMWSLGGVCGPFLGPLIGAALVQHHSWRYIFWFMLAVSGGFFIIMLLFFPETSAQEILMRKARKLRKTTGTNDYIAPGEIIQQSQTVKSILSLMFLKPIKLTLMEPILMLMNIHLGLVYSIIYLFMESFPIVYLGLRHFNLVEMGLAFMPFVIGAILSTFFYLFYIFMNKDRLDTYEKVFGPAAVFGSCLLPVSLLVWGWLQRSDIHWVIGMIGSLLFTLAAFTMFQTYFAMIGTMFPPNVSGSAFASNNIVRSLMAGTFPLFGTIIYEHTAIDRYPVGWGCTILAFIAILLIPLPIYLTIKGGSLRDYAQKKYGADRYANMN